MIHVTLYFAPDHVPAAMNALKTLFKEAWQEPQLDFCQVVQSADEPGVVRIQEAWNASRRYLDEVSRRFTKKDFCFVRKEVGFRIWFGNVCVD